MSFLLSIIIVFVLGGGALFAWMYMQNREEVEPEPPIVSLTHSTDEENETPEEVVVEDNTEEDNFVMDGEMTLIFGGDFLLDPGYAIMANILLQENGIVDSIDDTILAEMIGADICALNNEFPYTLRGEPLEEKTFTFRADPAYANLLHDIGVDLVSIANNHVFDYGEVGLTDTLAALDAAGIDRIGAGANLEEASTPAYYEINGVKVGIVAATEIEGYENPDTRGATESLSGVFRCLDTTNLENQIRIMKEEVDVVIVFVHWGVEGTDELNWKQQDHAQSMVDAGADLIVGAHPHCMQPIDYIDGVPVVYSLGNFLFNSSEGETALLKIEVTQDGIENLSLIPARQGNCKVYAMDSGESSAFYAYMESISPNITIDENGNIRQTY